MDYIVPILKNALDQQKFTPSDQQTITVIEVRRNDYIGDTCFVFHRKKDKALSSARPLPSNHATSRMHEFPVFVLS